MQSGRILVPVDFSDGSKRALRYAIQLARKLGASVHTVTIWQPDDQLPLDLLLVMGESTEPRTLADAARAHATLQIRSLLSHTDQRGIDPIQARVEVGEPAEVIAQLAESGDYDLIVMSTGDTRDSSRAIVGSIAKRVLRSSSVPVATLNALTQPGSSQQRNPVS